MIPLSHGTKKVMGSTCPWLDTEAYALDLAQTPFPHFDLIRSALHILTNTKA